MDRPQRPSARTGANPTSSIRSAPHAKRSAGLIWRDHGVAATVKRAHSAVHPTGRGRGQASGDVSSSCACSHGARVAPATTQGQDDQGHRVALRTFCGPRSGTRPSTARRSLFCAPRRAGFWRSKPKPTTSSGAQNLFTVAKAFDTLEGRFREGASEARLGDVLRSERRRPETASDQVSDPGDRLSPLPGVRLHAQRNPTAWE